MLAEALLEVPALLCQPASAPYRSILAGPAPGAEGIGSGPGVTCSRGGAPLPPGGESLGATAVHPPTPSSGTVRVPHSPAHARTLSLLRPLLPCLYGSTWIAPSARGSGRGKGAWRG